MIYFKIKNKFYRWNIASLLFKGLQFLTVTAIMILLSMNFDEVALW